MRRKTKHYVVLLLSILVVMPVIWVGVRAEATSTAVQVIRFQDLGLSESGVNTYMAHFISDDLLMVASSHGDVDLGGRYVSSAGNMYIFKFENGKWTKIKTLSSGTYRVGTWTQVTSEHGYFSGNGRYLLEDMASGQYGTNAKVIDLSDLSTRTIDFSGLPSTNFYPCQIDYTGDYIASGTQSGDIYVWKWDPSQNKYVLIFSYHISGNIRRLHMTLDARWLIVGGLNDPHLYIFKRTESTFELVNTIDLEDGVGALGITDPWNVGYIAVGGDSGWVYVFNATKDPANPELIFKEQLGTGRFYNPFYDRFMPKNVIVLAFKQFSSSSSDSTPAVIVDVMARYGYKFNEIGRASAVSPSGTWVLLGDAIYMVVQKDIQTGTPRIRFWGRLDDYRPNWYLDKPIVLEAPEESWHAYFYGGTLYVSRLYTEAIRDSLIEDTAVRQGLVGVMADKGLVEPKVALEEGSEVNEINMTKADLGEGIDRSVVVSMVSTIKRVYHTAEVAVPVVLKIPLDKPIDPYSSITLMPNLVVTLGSMIQDSYTGKAIGAVAIGAGVGYATLGAKLMSNAWIIASRNVFAKYGVEALARATVSSLASTIAGESGLYASLGAIMAGVGVILAVVATIDTAYAWLKAGATPMMILMVVPVIEDMSTGEKYACGALYLPLEAIRAGEQAKYIDHIKALLSLYGIDKVGIAVYSFRDTWDEYRKAISKGFLPRPNLLEIINSTIINPYGLSRDKVRITEVLIAFENYIIGSVSLFQRLLGGIKVYSVLQITGHGIDVIGTIPGGEVITDPERISSILGSVKINGVEYSFSPSDYGAKVDFAMPVGAEKLAVEFGKAGYFADIHILCDVVVKKDFEPLEDFGYVVDFHYNWNNTMIRLNKIELVDMPYPMVYVERTFIYKYGNFTHPMTDAFELSGTYDDPTSPSGKRYTYVTYKNTKYIDPANGGILQPCKHYVIRYFYKQPPDVALFVYLNGTQITSTKARHATIVLNSSAEQDVDYVIIFRVKMLKGFREVTLLEDKDTGTLHVYANGTAYKTYLIEKYVDYAVRVMAENGTPAFVEIYARITKAKYDYIKDNDEKTVVYYPPFSLVELYGKNATLSIYVYDAMNGTSISGALVKVYNGTVTYSGYTNATGWAEFNVTVGLWNVSVTKDGYNPYSTQLYVYDNMTFNVALVPEGATIPVIPPVNNTNPPVIYANKEYWWLSVQVLYKDGMPFHGAVVRVYNVSSGSLLFEKVTNGTGFVHFLILNGTDVRVEVNATNPENATQTYFESRELVITHHTWLVFKTPWTSEYYQPEVGLTFVDVVIHWGAGYYFGNVSHLVMLGIWTNVPQTVTVNLTLVDASTNETIGFKQLTLDLVEGVNVNMTWFDVNATKGKYVRAHAVIVSYENDTDPDNNELWSDVVFLKPFMDIRVFVRWRPVEQKLPYAILPGDVIEVDVGIEVPMNLTTVPMNFTANILSRDIMARVFRSVEMRREAIKTVTGGIVWRNFTLTVPWTNKIVVEVNATHPWEMYSLNNNMTLTINIDPDIELEVFTTKEKIKYIVEGHRIEYRIRIRSNVEPGEGYAFIMLYDETTGEEVASKRVVLEPVMALDFTSTAPENPYAWSWEIERIGFKIGIKKPTATHLLNCTVSGTDFYLENNYKGMEITVVSYQMAFVLGIIVLAVILILLFSLVKGARGIIPYRPRKYVRFKSL